MTERFPKLLSALGLLIGTAAAFIHHQRGLTLSHYDAKAHLVVARRVLDSLTPEYSQIGAVWLPLPHLLNLLPVQVDWFYRTGASGVAISILAFSVACYAIAHLVLRATGSRTAATIAVAMFALNPDVLYLQSTPMTEPLMFGLVLLSICFVYDWVDVQDRATALYHREAHDEARAYAVPAGCAEARCVERAMRRKRVRRRDGALSSPASRATKRGW